MCNVLFTTAGKSAYNVVRHFLFYQVVVTPEAKVTVLKLHMALADKTEITGAR